MPAKKYDLIGITARVNARTHIDCDKSFGRRWVCQCASCRFVRERARKGFADYKRVVEYANGAA